MNWMRFAEFAFALVAVVLMSYQSTRAQATVAAGSLQGTVTDPQGGVVANAKVTITNKDTGGQINSNTSSAGQFASGYLTPGTYTVRVEAASFKTTEVTASVLINVVTPANIKLELGSASTVVEVTNQAVTVNTEQAQVSGSLTTQQIENLPINGRNFLDLAQLEPGVQIQDGGNFDPTKIGFSSISFGGRFGRSARIAVDGVDVSDETVGTTTTGIPASAIQEFQVAQSSLDLSNDLTSGGAVNVATKSGTNSIHGEAFGLFRDNSQAAVYPAGALFQRSQYGGNVGGPVVKDKLFFFVGGEKLLAHDAGGVLVANIPSGIDNTNLSSFSGTFPAPFHDGSILGKLDWQATKKVHVFGRFSYWQNSDEGNFGGAANYSVYVNKDRTTNLAGGVDFATGSFTHSFRAEHLKFVNVIADSVVGSNLPFAHLGVELSLSGTGFLSGPSFLAPQSTIQSDRQVKYDGSKVWGSHIIRYGVGYNQIVSWAFANLLGIAPEAVSMFLGAPGTLTCPASQRGAACPLNYLTDIVLIGNGQGSFTELSRFGKPNGGLGPDNRLGAYFGDSWKIKPNLTLTAGVRYVRDTGRTDSDLNTTQVINNFFPGFGDPVRQPNKNFAPQVGIAWDPKGNGKTVIRAGAGLYYDSILFNNVLFDRLLRLSQGAFNIIQLPCNFGAAGIPFGDGTTQFIGGSRASGNVICPQPNATFTGSTGTVVGAVLPVDAGNCAGETFAVCIANFQSAFQASYAAGGSNVNFVPFALQNNLQVLTGLLDPNYKSPRAFQGNVGIQRELRPGMVLSVDYLRNVGLHYLLAQDINHTGDVAFFNKTAAANAINTTNAAFGCPAGDAGIECAVAAGASLSNYAAAGLDSPYDLGSGASIGQFAFGGINPNAPAFYMSRPNGRSVYNAMGIKLTQNSSHPFKDLKYMNLQFAYALSRFVNAGSTTSGAAIFGGDQDFITSTLDNRNPLSLTGPGSLDRTHQFNIGGYADLALGIRLGLISHFWSPFAGTPTMLPVAGSVQSGAPGGIFVSDFLGTGQIGNPLPIAETDPSCGTFGGNCTYTTYKVGAFMRGLSSSGLNTAINNYNTNIAGLPTPAGQALINAGLVTLANLRSLGAVSPAVAPPPPGQVGLGWLKDFDMEISWVGHAFHDRLTIQPSVSFFNVFNFANFDSAANALIGQLNGSPGSINGTVQAGRPDRIGAGTGVFAFGAPRTIEWGLKLSF